MFTASEQAGNRLKLAHYMSRNVKDVTYNHIDIHHNAIGYAAKQCIGGLYFEDGKAAHKDYPLEQALVQVFGEYSITRVFSPVALDHNNTRLSVIKALRNF